MMTNDLIETLLFEEEGSTLDFKSEQYRFSKASDEDKSELLKDILAFANAWKRSDAYILIGVREEKGARSEIIGVSEDLDDAQVQQFVQSKVNKPIQFSYLTAEIDSKKVALITVPVQARPVFLKKDYGKLKANTVYVRRGSSTSIALPDEIASMGTADHNQPVKAPSLSPFIASGEHDEIRSLQLDTEVVLAELPDSTEFPRYETQSSSDYLALSSLHLDRANPNYYAEYAEYFGKVKRITGFKIGIENVGNRVARGVRAVLDFSKLPEGVKVFHEKHLPDRPRSSNGFGIHNHLIHQPVTYDVHVSKSQSGYRVEVDFGKVQAKDLVVCHEYIFLSVSKAFQENVSVLMFSDDLDAPAREEFQIKIDTKEEKYTVQHFVEVDD